MSLTGIDRITHYKTSSPTHTFCQGQRVCLRQTGARILFEKRKIRVKGLDVPLDGGCGTLMLAVEGEGISIQMRVTISPEDARRIDLAIARWDAAYTCTLGYEGCPEMISESGP